MTALRSRLRLLCRGAVQGVGFRPTVYRLAQSLKLGGWVLNGPDGVVIEVEGGDGQAADFAARLPRELPPLARLDDYEVLEVEARGEQQFAVRPSEQGPRRRALVPADAALCTDCAHDMQEQGNRRHHYAFTTCTNCGPRFSLVRGLPYDREKTSMACFPLCPECHREYSDPADRRFHAEPVCCPACGPALWVVDALGQEIGRGPAAVDAARAALAAGGIVALKALGGFQLACRADRDGPCALLRTRKRRPAKPFALMARDLAAAQRLVQMTAADEALLCGPRAPIVLAPRRADAGVARQVAPGLQDLGVMLPTTPLHRELFRGLDCDVLVMTSGNLSDEPICRGNREAVQRLGAIADLFLLHDRDVVRRVDDSIVRSAPEGPVMLRRARGWVPDPLPLPEPAPVPVLALGGHLQATACLAVQGEAFLSQHVGDQDSAPARAFLEEVIAGLEQFLEARPQLFVVDAHPDYPSAQLGERMAAEAGARLLKVQHHLAHLAAVLAEHGRFPQPDETIAGLALDGTGWGPDGTAWGGEFLALDGRLRWRRLAHLEQLPLLGGEQAVREPWRTAVAALVRAGRPELLARLPLAAEVSALQLEQMKRLAGQAGWPRASGAGRVFEAAGALFGFNLNNDYEGEAAIRFEALAAQAEEPAAAWQELRLPAGAHGVLLPSSRLLLAAAERLAGGEDPAQVAAGFHSTFAALAVEILRRVRPAKARVVALGGGCLANRLLSQGLAAGIRAQGLEVLLPRAVPPGDGGLAFGQAALAAAALARATEPQLVEAS